MKLNALVVDLSVLGPDGWGFLERVSGMLPGLGIVVCTQNSTVAQRVRGLRLGADDWVAKPAHPEEVAARVEAVVRRRKRSQPKADAGPLVAGEVEVRPDQFQAFVSDRSLGLTRREFELLQVLADGAGQGDRARGSLPARLGLRDGARRSLGRRLRAQAAGEAPEGLARHGATSTPTSGWATASSRSRRRRAPSCPTGCGFRRRLTTRSPPLEAELDSADAG